MQESEKHLLLHVPKQIAQFGGGLVELGGLIGDATCAIL